MHYLAFLNIQAVVPLDEFQGVPARAPQHRPAPAVLLRDVLLRRLRSDVEGRFSAEHGCHVLLITEIVGHSRGILTRSRPAPGMPGAMYGAPAPPAATFRARIRAVVSRVWPGEVVDCHVRAVTPSAVIAQAGPATVHVAPPPPGTSKGGVLRLRITRVAELVTGQSCDGEVLHP